MMKEYMQLKLHLGEGSQVGDCVCRVERRGIAGPDGERKFWLVRTPVRIFVNDLPPTEFLILGPGGKDERFESTQDDIVNSIVIQAMLDITNRAPDIDSFDWPSVRFFAKGIATRLND
jgi:hypothetical protein